MTAPYTVVARNLPEHAGNAIHTDAGAVRAGFPAALVAGVTTYAYLTHPVVVAWGRDWLRDGTARVRFRAPVFAGDRITCAPRPSGDGLAVDAVDLAGGPPRAVLEAALGAPAPPPPPDGEPVPTVRLRLEGEYGPGYGRRAGDGLDLYERAGIVHPAVWPALANHVVHRYVAQGAWIHLGSAIAHHGLALEGAVAEVRSVVTERFERKERQHAVLDVRIVVDGTLVASLAHEAIVRLP